MSGRFAYRLERTHPAALLVLRGVLDAYTAADLRVAVLDCLSDQPARVLIDATEVSVADDMALTALAGVARASGRWPSSHFAVFGATPDLAAAAERVGLAPDVPVFSSRTDAEAALSRWPVPPVARLRIRPDRFAPGVAREAIQAFCATWGVREGTTAQLVASELVTNAVMHAGTPIDLTLRLVPPHLHIAVRDGAGGDARISADLGEDAQSGRGLLLVDALATDWGTFVPHDGKIVWARVRVRSAAGDSTRPAVSW